MLILPLLCLYYSFYGYGSHSMISPRLIPLTHSLPQLLTHSLAHSSHLPPNHSLTPLTHPLLGRAAAAAVSGVRARSRGGGIHSTHPHQNHSTFNSPMRGRVGSTGGASPMHPVGHPHLNPPYNTPSSQYPPQMFYQPPPPPSSSSSWRGGGMGVAGGGMSTGGMTGGGMASGGMASGSMFETSPAGFMHVGNVGVGMSDPFDQNVLHGLSEAICMPDLRNALQAVREVVEWIMSNRLVPQPPQLVLPPGAQAPLPHHQQQHRYVNAPSQCALSKYPIITPYFKISSYLHALLLICLVNHHRIVFT